MPADDEADPLICRLRVASLLERPRLPCALGLSYVWGDESDRRPITVDNVTATITANLADALRAFRAHHRPLKGERGGVRMFWADALCINQIDVPEKNTQVPLTADIYSRSRNVLICLGTAGVCTRAFFTLLASNRLIISDPRSSLDSRTLRSLLYADDPAESVIEVLDVFHGLLEIAARPYWQRMWTFQEVLLAGSPPVCYYGHGQTVFLEAEFLRWLAMYFFEKMDRKFIDLFSDNNRPLRDALKRARLEAAAGSVPFATAMQRWRPIQEAAATAGVPYDPEEFPVNMPRHSKDNDGDGSTPLEAGLCINTDSSFLSLVHLLAHPELSGPFRLQKRIPIEVLLLITRNRRCTNPRDRVYGLMGLSPVPLMTSPTPDYALPMTEVLSDMWRALLLHRSQAVDGGIYDDDISANEASDFAGFQLWKAFPLYRDCLTTDIRPSWLPDVDRVIRNRLSMVAKSKHLLPPLPELIPPPPLVVEDGRMHIWGRCVGPCHVLLILPANVDIKAQADALQPVIEETQKWHRRHDSRQRRKRRSLSRLDYGEIEFFDHMQDILRHYLDSGTYPVSPRDADISLGTPFIADAGFCGLGPDGMRDGDLAIVEPTSRLIVFLTPNISRRQDVTWCKSSARTPCYRMVGVGAVYGLTMGNHVHGDRLEWVAKQPLEKFVVI